MDMDNYKNALELLQTQEISEELICKIGINRKALSMTNHTIRSIHA